MHRGVWLAGLLLLLQAPAGRAGGLDPLRGRRVVAVHFEGRFQQGLSQVEALKYVDVHPGDRFSLRSVRRSIKLLYHLGLFGQVRATAELHEKGMVLTFHLVPKRRVLSVAYLGNEVVPASDLRRLSRLRRGEEFDRWKMEATAQDILELYARRGYRRTRIIPEVEGAPDRDVVVKYFIQEGPPTRVSKIWFKGQTVFRHRKLIEVISLERGDALDDDRLQDDLARLKKFYRDNDYLEVRISTSKLDFGHTANWEVVPIEIQAGPRVSFAYQGNAVLKRRDLLKAIKLEEEGELNQYVLRDQADRLENLYRRHGYAKVQVTPAATLDQAAGTKEVVFTVEEGPRVTVRDVQFAGNRAFGDDKLRKYIDNALLDALSQSLILQPVDRGDMDQLGGGHPLSKGPRRVNRPQGFLFELVPETIYLRTPYERALEQISDLYRSQGYLEVHIQTPILSYGDGGSSLYITIPIEEGPQTQVESISFEGNQKIAASELLRVADQHTGLVRPGAPLSLYGVDQLRKELIRTYANRGYVYCRVKQQMLFSNDRTLAGVHYIISEGPQVEVGRVIVRGNVVTRKEVFENTLTFRSGETFSTSKVANSQEDLFGLGVFSGVDIKMVDPDVVEPRKDVVVTVRERLPHAMTFSPGISSAEGARVQLDYTHRNLFGYAMEFIGKAKVNYQIFYPLLPEGSRESYEELGFLEGLEGWVVTGLHWPRVWWLDKDLAARIDLIGLQDHAPSYDLQKVSLTPGVDFKLQTNLALSIEYEVEGAKLGCTIQDCAGAKSEEKWRRYDEGSLLLGAFRPEISWDRRDNLFKPHRGTFMSLRTELANGLAGPDVFYLKLDGVTSVYLPLGRDTTLALSLRGGVIVHLTESSQTPSHKRFWLGGRNTVRSFAEEYLLPADQVNPEDPGSPCIPRKAQDDEVRCISLGGNAMLILKSELRFPLIPDTLDGALFVDLGNLWVHPENVNPLNLRPAAGFGIRFITPIGPVAFDFGFNLDPDPSRAEESWNLHFNIGVF